MIYSQSFLFSALREDSSKSNSRGGQGVIFSTSWQSFVARGASATSLWQGGTGIRFLGHIGCQSDFDELVSMASRPVDRGFGRRRSFSTSFCPPRYGLGRTVESFAGFG